MPKLRVMTFNIRGACYQEDGVNAWEFRASLNIKTIRSAMPDLIGFQELQMGNHITYQQRLTEFDAVLGPKTANKEPYDYNAIFWKSSRLQKIKTGGFWLSETPERPSPGWDATCIRAATWIHFRIADGGQEFLHVNTHLDHLHAQARQKGTELLLQRIVAFEQAKYPIISTGDFNCHPHSPVYELLLESGFVDTYLATGNRDGDHSTTFHAYRHIPLSSGEEPGRLMRFDWILLRDPSRRMHPLCCEIIRDAEPPVYPSDHYPVLTEFGVREVHE
jgi:endonuclease/exonuclease/phosphatase family metal-dependent hydrolase